MHNFKYQKFFRQAIAITTLTVCFVTGYALKPVFP